MASIKSNFKLGADGWTAAGDVEVFEWRSTGGNKGGYIYWDDTGSGADSYWLAPEKFLGDLSRYRHGALSFDWFASANNYQAGDVLITGANGDTLVGDVTNPGTNWTHASISLGVDGGWHLGSIEGPLATKQQITAVLNDVTEFEIRAEHVNGDENGGLDNVVLTSRVPTPPASAFGADHHEMSSAHAFMGLHQVPDLSIHVAVA